MTDNRLEKCLSQWYNQINDALDKHCPKRKIKPRDLNNPWWTAKLQQMRKKLKIEKRKQLQISLSNDFKDKQKTYKKRVCQSKNC